MLAVQLLYSVPSLSVDQSKGAPSLNLVTHQLALREFPFQFPEKAGFFVTNAWLGEPGSYEQKIIISKPDGSSLVETAAMAFELEHSQKVHTMVSFFQGLKIEVPGLYSVKILFNGEAVRHFPLAFGNAPEAPEATKL